MTIKILPGVIAGLVVYAQTASAQILDSVELAQERDSAAIQARFAAPVQYVSHFPEKSGDTLQIYLRVIRAPDTRKTVDAADERKTFRPAKLDGLPLRDVTYEEGGSEGPRLIVRFDRETRYTVRASADQRSIVVNVPRAPKDAPGNRSTFVIDLATLDRRIAMAPSLPADMQAYRVYAIPYSGNNGVRYRLRLGFFDTLEEATAVKNRLQAQFPKASISLTHASERDESSNLTLAASPVAADVQSPPPSPLPSLAPPAVTLPPPTVASKPKPKPEPKVKPDPKAKDANNESAADLFAAGRSALQQGANLKAIQLFTQLLSLAPNAYSADAQEFLGVARERNGQIDLAKVEYKLYLKQYSEGEGAQRVQQRLAALEPSAPSALIPEKNLAAPSNFQTYGTVAQNYFHGASKVDSNTTGTDPSRATFSQVDQSLLVTHADAISRYRDAHYDNRIVFSGDYLTDFLNHDKSSQRVSSAYLELADRGHTAAARLGRQSGNARGVLGRFDGALLGYNFLPLWRTDVVIGKPVDNIAPASRRAFAGADLAMGPFRDRWNGSLYAIQQDVDNFVDRRAVGGELRYFDATHTLFSLLDYDVYFGAVNIAMLQGSWQPTPATNFNFLVDRRKSPPLQLTNALQTETAQSINELSATMNEQEMKQLARSRTADSNVAVVGVTRTLTPRVQLGGNVTYLNISDSTVGQGSGSIYTYDTQLIANNVVFRDDVDVIAVSYSDGRDYQATALSMVTRVPLRKTWRIDFGLRLYRQNNTVGTQLDRITPSLKLDYRTAHGLTLESEWGYERSHVTGLDREETTGLTFFMVGWRLDW